MNWRNAVAAAAREARQDRARARGSVARRNEIIVRAVDVGRASGKDVADWAGITPAMVVKIIANRPPSAEGHG